MKQMPMAALRRSRGHRPPAEPGSDAPGLDCFALALRTPRVRFLVLGDVLIALEGHSALLAVVLVGRHRRLLQARTLFVGGPHARHAPGGTRLYARGDARACRAVRAAAE